MKYDLILSLGSNIEPRVKYLKHTIEELKLVFFHKFTSSIYETSPLIDTNQDYFYNICCYFKTNISNPISVLNITKEIENKIGRVKDKTRPKGPRKIDIDIILLDRIKFENNFLTIPHKSFLERNFVLIPMLEIFSKYPILNINYDLPFYIEKNIDQKVTKIGDLYNE